MKSLSTHIQFAGAILVALFLSISLQVLAFSAPTVAPPGGNTPSPLTTSATGQVKVGGLSLNSGGAVNGLIVALGRVGIGTSSPADTLDVRGGDINTSGKLKEGGNPLLPSGTVLHFNLSSCPGGWSELTQARGRYIVGLPSSGTLAGTAGSALLNLENRAVGQHNHAVNDPGHQHSITNAILGAGGPGGGGGFISGPLSTQLYIEPRATGVTIQDAGAVAGTNAPYIQLLVCQKD